MTENSTIDKVYDPRAVEPGVFKRWEESDAFSSKPTDPPTPHDKTFTIVIPPPNVTGALHLGHALNNTLQDILIRYHRMRGFNTLWQPGTDHAGIATQAVVERRIREEEGKTRHELGRDELVKRIWKWKDQYEARIIGQLKLMGCSCDWQRLRFTLDDGLARAVREIFFRLFKDGLIFRGKRLVNWDTQLQTAVSDDEVYYETVKGHFWHFKYPVIDPKPGEPEHVIIATTRPETMLGDTAVAVNPDPQGFFDKQEAALKDLWDRLSSRSGKEASEIKAKLNALATRRESHLAGLIKLRDMAKDGRKLMLPLVERVIPLICDEWADPTKGSGCVKITPAHDPNDYEVGQRCKLPMINVLTADGNVAKIVEADGSPNPHSAEYDGLVFASEGRKKVVADMETRGLLHEVEAHEVELGHSDRSKTPIEPFLSDQWFIRTGDTSEPRASARAEFQAHPEPQASACAVPRTPDLSQGATLLTWTTYGTWLPGDERGFVSRVPRADGSHFLQNLPGEPYDADEPQLVREAEDRMEGEPVLLSAKQAKTLLATIAATCERHGVELLAIAIMRNHVHVLCQSDRHGAELLQLIKGNASHVLNRSFGLTDAPRWWTKSGSRRRIRPRADLTAAIEYVQNQAFALQVWSFDVDTGPAWEIVQSSRAGVHDATDSGGTARAEARGSGELRPPIGATVTGLAQAAMNAVNNDRIKVFPTRYAKSYLDWLGEKRDWCISRQLWWGHRIPVWSFELSDAGAQAFLTGLSLPSLNETHACTLWRELPQRPSIANTVSISTSELTAEWFDGINDPTDAFDGCAGSAQTVKQLQVCLMYNDAALITELEHAGFRRSDDVLDTWFSSALWPFSTLGWPEQTSHLKQYYPGSVLVTNRDIITNWVARMVMFGLYTMGDVPFDRVYIHPKILDGRGETMSKSKGNGVDPVDIIHNHGADALRFAMADMCTETQDIRVPVEYICPHCKKLTDQETAIKAETQGRKSRGEKLTRKLQPSDCLRVTCSNKDCGKEFATQWADDETKKKLGFGRETSDKFDIGRNFCNKLWNASRFAFMNLDGAPCESLDIGTLPAEDRWILARLSQTIRDYHKHMGSYLFSASVKELRDFFWDGLCDWYIELTKPRMNGERSDCERATAQQVLAFCIDQTLRLWHPTIPFISEHLWQNLERIVPKRGLPGVADLTCDTDLVTAPFPPVEGYPALEDDAILTTFAQLQDATRGVRDLRAGCGVSPKEKLTVTVVVPADHVEALAAHAHIVQHMANIGTLNVSTDAKRPPNAGSLAVGNLRIFVHDISDDDAERTRVTKQLAHVEKQIQGKKGKLANEKFIANASREVVEAERKRLAQLLEERASLNAHVSELKD